MMCYIFCALARANKSLTPKNEKGKKKSNQIKQMIRNRFQPCMATITRSDLLFLDQTQSAFSQ